MKKALLILAFLAATLNISTHAHAISADIMWLIDTSVSMTQDIADVKARMAQFNDAMINAGIDAHYGLTEFGGKSDNGITYGTATLYQNIVDYNSFITGTPFANLDAQLGSNEPGSIAVTTALQNATFRTGSVVNFILVTDEGDSASAAEFAAADAALAAKGALFNFIGRPGFLNTDERYGVLAANHGGAAFDINDFRNNGDLFFQSFVRTKVEEIRGGVVPEPTTVLLFTTGLAGAAFRRKFLS